MASKFLILAVVVACLLNQARADLPIHCLKVQVEGIWKLFLSGLKEVTDPKDARCGYFSPSGALDAMQNTPDSNFKVKETIEVRLDKYNKIYDPSRSSSKRVGTWTMMYDEGMIIEHKRLSMFVFFRYSLWQGSAMSDCSKTLIGWYRDEVTGKMGCFYGEQVQQSNLVSSTSTKNMIKGVQIVPYTSTESSKNAIGTSTTSLAASDDNMKSFRDVFYAKRLADRMEDGNKIYASFARTEACSLSSTPQQLTVQPNPKTKSAKTEGPKNKASKQSKTKAKIPSQKTIHGANTAKAVVKKAKQVKKSKTLKPSTKKSTNLKTNIPKKVVKAAQIIKKGSTKKQNNSKATNKMAKNLSKTNIGINSSTKQPKPVPNPSTKGKHISKSTSARKIADIKSKARSLPSVSQKTAAKSKKTVSKMYALEMKLEKLRRTVKIKEVKAVKIDQNQIKVSKKPKSMTVNKGYNVKKFDVRVHVHWMRKPKHDKPVTFLAQIPASKLVVDTINQAKLGWTAYEYPNLAGKSIKDISSMSGSVRFFQTDQSEKISNSERIESDVEFAQTMNNLPQSFSLEKYLSEPRTQKTCGNCYLIATIGMLESRIKLKYGRDFPLSIQYLNDCNHYAQGCDGGFASESLRYIHQFWALPDRCKPFEARQGMCEGHCSMQFLQEIVTVDKPYFVGDAYDKATEHKLMEELYKHGPVVVNFEPTYEFAYYRSGIFKPLKGTIQQIFHGDTQWIKVDHSVLLYGWGEENGQKFWLVQNSWGETWGENGTFKIVRGQNTLGIEVTGEAAHPKFINLKTLAASS